MPDFFRPTIINAKTLAEGDLLVTFSDETIVLYHAKFLYDVRNHDSNINIVDPFEE